MVILRAGRSPLGAFVRSPLGARRRHRPGQPLYYVRVHDGKIYVAGPSGRGGRRSVDDGSVIWSIAQDLHSVWPMGDDLYVFRPASTVHDEWEAHLYARVAYSDGSIVQILVGDMSELSFATLHDGITDQGQYTHAAFGVGPDGSAALFDPDDFDDWQESPPWQNVYHVLRDGAKLYVALNFGVVRSDITAWSAESPRDWTQEEATYARRLAFAGDKLAVGSHAGTWLTKGKVYLLAKSDGEVLASMDTDYPVVDIAASSSTRVYAVIRARTGIGERPSSLLALDRNGSGFDVAWRHDMSQADDGGQFSSVATIGSDVLVTVGFPHPTTRMKWRGLNRLRGSDGVKVWEAN